MKTQNIRVTHVFRVVVVLAQMFAHLHHTSYIFPYIIYHNIFYITVFRYILSNSLFVYFYIYVFILVKGGLFCANPGLKTSSLLVSFDYFLEEKPLSFALSTSLSKTKKELFNFADLPYKRFYLLTMISKIMREWFFILFKYDFHLYKLMLE